MKLSKSQAKAMALLPLHSRDVRKKVNAATWRNLAARGLAVPVPCEDDSLMSIWHARWRILPASYLAIREKAKEIGWPLGFKSDLIRDRDDIMNYSPERFGWVLCDIGTRLELPEIPDCEPIDFAYIIKDYASSPNRRFFWWNGNCLSEESASKLGYLLQEAHQKFIERRGNRLNLTEAQVIKRVTRSYLTPDEPKIVWREPNVWAQVEYLNQWVGRDWVDVRRGSDGKVFLRAR